MCFYRIMDIEIRLVVAKWKEWIGGRMVVLEKTPETPLDSKEIKPVNPKENQP